jgi:hypothetical protein
MITVHHLETSRSQRVLWLLEELGVPYELKAVHPLGKSPVITDGAETVAESGAILDALRRRLAHELAGDEAAGTLHLVELYVAALEESLRFWEPSSRNSDMSNRKGGSMAQAIASLELTLCSFKSRKSMSSLATIGSALASTILPFMLYQEPK